MSDHHPANAAPQTKSKPCIDCGYDLRGINSPVCPECGAARAWRRLTFLNPELHFAAVKALNDAGIRVRSFGKQDHLVAIDLGLQLIHELWIGMPDNQAAMEALEQAGVDVSWPIVDRAEPQCPTCNSQLDPQGPAECPECGMLFDWVEIEGMDNAVMVPTAATEAELHANAPFRKRRSNIRRWLVLMLSMVLLPLALLLGLPIATITEIDYPVVLLIECLIGGIIVASILRGADRQ